MLGLVLGLRIGLQLVWATVTAGVIVKTRPETIYYGSGSGPGNGSGTSGVIVPAPGLFDQSAPCNRFL